MCLKYKIIGRLNYKELNEITFDMNSLKRKNRLKRLFRRASNLFTFLFRLIRLNEFKYSVMVIILGSTQIVTRNEKVLLQNICFLYKMEGTFH